MKKFIVLASVLLLILAFGVTAYSQEKKEPTLSFKATGFIDAYGYVKTNVPDSGTTPANQGLYGPALGPDYIPGGGGYDKTDSYWVGRGRFTLNWSLDTYASGVFQFEIDSTRWGERTATAPAAGKTVGTERGRAGQWDADRAALEVKHMYIQFAFPNWIPIPIPMNLMVGIQPIGYAPRWIINNDGAGITFAMKPDPLSFKIGYYKVGENKYWAADDSDAYAADINVKIQTLTVGGIFAYYNYGSYPLTDTEPTSRAKIWWAGLYADGKVGPVNLQFDFGYDNGKVEDRRDLPAASRWDDVKYSGWATRLKVDFPWEKFNFGVIGVYGSGADANKCANETDQIGYLTANGSRPDKVGVFVIPDASGGGGTDAIILSVDTTRATVTYAPAPVNIFRNPMGGLWMAQLYGAAKVTPWYNVKLAAMYFGDTTKHGNTFGNAVKSGTTTLRDDKEIGWEFDLVNTFNIWKGVDFQLFGAYLFAGKGLDYQVGTSTLNDSPENPWVIGTKFVYNF